MAHELLSSIKSCLIAPAEIHLEKLNLLNTISMWARTAPER